MVVFPHMIVPVFVSEESCIKAVEAALESDRRLFLSAFRVIGLNEPGLESSLAPPFDVYDTGTICTIMRTRKLADGRMKVLVQGVLKASVDLLAGGTPYPLVQVRTLPDEELEPVSSKYEALDRAVRENLEKIVSLGKVLSPDILVILEDVKEPGKLADLVAANLGLKVDDGQRVLSTLNPLERLQKANSILSREIEVFQMQAQIQTQAREEIGKLQREHYLREQIRVLRSELGDSDPKDEVEDFWRTLEELNLPYDTKTEIARQIKRLERMHQDASEATLTRTHIETLLNLPWNTRTPDVADIAEVMTKLDGDHYGLDRVKDRIAEYLAVKTLNPGAKSPILCFVGAPGVGKTSLGRSIADAIGRNFSRISLGGVRDEADIRGHRKTYIGAFPGRVIQSIKQAGSSNPVIMLDEIDKLGSDHRGDPAAALLEVLDPEQNNSFVDHYLGVPFDLSSVFFIANANDIDQVPSALRDRLEVINVSGYSEEEKVEIATRFLIPKQKKETGLSDFDVSFSREATQVLVKDYTHESGLRGLEKQISSVFRKIAREVAESRREVRKITPSVLRKLLGAKKYQGSFFVQQPHVGVALAMAYTRMGGDILTIETTLVKTKGEGRLVLTGQIGQVMQESAQAAWTYLKSKTQSYLISDEIFNRHDLHVHVPQGAVPKEGPSAGVAICTSIVSAVLNKVPMAGVCITGEITLHGNVLPVGGIREKLLAAQREGFETAILPAANEDDFDDLPASLKKKIKPVFIKHYNEVFELLFDKISKRDLISSDFNELAS